MAFLEAWAGKYAVSGVAAMMETGGYEKIKEFYEELSASSGAASQTASVMADNTKGAYISLQSAIEAAKISVGEAFLPMVRSSLEGLTSIVRSIATFASENPALVQGFGAIATTAAASVVGLGGFRLALAGMNFVSTSVELMKATAAFRMFSSTAASSTGLFARLASVSTAFRTAGLAAGFSMLGTSISTAARSMLTFLSMPITATMGAVSSVTAKLRAAFAAFQAHGLMSFLRMLGLGLSGAARAAAAFIFSPWGVALAAIAAIAAAAYALYSNWDKVGGYFENAFGRIGGAFSEIGAAVMPSFERLGSALTGMFDAVSTSGLMSALTGGVMIAVEVLTGGLTTAMGLIGNLLSMAANVGAALSGAFELLLRGELVGAVGKLGEAFTSVFKGAFEMVRTTFRGIFNTVENVMKLAGGLIDGSILRGEFDYGSLKGAAEAQNASKSATLREEKGRVPAPKSAPLPWQNLPSTLGASKPVEPPSTGLIGELIGSLGRFFETKSESAPTRAVSSSIAPVPAQADVITLPPIKVPEIDLRAAFESAASSATEVFSTIGMSLTEAFSSASMMASEAFVSIQTSMSELQMSATMFGAEISMALTEAFSGLSETVGAALTGVLSTVMSVGNEIIGFVSGTLAGAWDAAWNAMLASFSGVFSSLGGIAQGVLGGILSTVQSIASAISSISLPNFGGGGTSIGHHAEGGIYAKGAHLTWFAETSAEAAIPIVRDRNSIGLWTRVGQMLGLLPKSGGESLSKPKSGGKHLPPFKGSIPILSIPRAGGRRPLPPEQVEAAAAAARAGNPLSLSIPRISPAPSPFKADEDLVPNVRESKSYESLQSRVNEFERLRSEKESARESSFDNSSIPPITLHFTFNGSADREGVKAGVMESLPMIRESFEEQLNRYRHEKARRSF